MTGPMSAASDAPRPLEGVRVVELAHWMAGPAACGVLADWGADVVKVEPHGGEPMRHIWGSMGANPDAPNGAFTSANRGKRSVELDVRSTAGRSALDALLDRADVLVSNLRPAALRRLGLAPEVVAERFPRLVYCSLTAYGWGGPDEERAGYDLASFFGRTGIAHEITTQGQPPAPLMQGLGDTFAAMASVAGILAALHERDRTGRGRFVESSLLRTGMWALAGELGVQAMGGRPRPPYPRENCPTPMYNSYRTADDRWFYLVGVEAGRHLPRRDRSVRPAGGRAVRHCPRDLEEPARVPPDPRRGVRRAPPRALGRGVRRTRRVVGAGADPGRGDRGPAGARRRCVGADRRRADRGPAGGVGRLADPLRRRGPRRGAGAAALRSAHAGGAGRTRL
jgi:hypothetical protein